MCNWRNSATRFVRVHTLCTWWQPVTHLLAPKVHRDKGFQQRIGDSKYLVSVKRGVETLWKTTYIAHKYPILTWAAHGEDWMFRSSHLIKKASSMSWWLLFCVSHQWTGLTYSFLTLISNGIHSWKTSKSNFTELPVLKREPVCQDRGRVCLV